jgi:fructose-1-phosphate kinase PfkB-like protein
MSAFLCLFSIAAAQSNLIKIPITRRSNTIPAGTSIEAGLVNDLDDYAPINDLLAQSAAVSLFSTVTTDATTQ